MILQEWLNIWLNKYIKHTIKLRTFLTYESICKKHINPILGNYQLTDLSSKIIQDFLLNKLENGNLNNNEALSYNTVKMIYSILRKSLNSAYDFEIINIDYTKKIILPKNREKNIEVFDSKEQKLLESFCLNNKKKNYFGIILCLYTGIRLGELLALTWDDIDFNKKLLSINKTASYIKINNTFTTYIDTPKTSSSNRTIPLPKQLLPYLRNMKKTSKAKYVIATRNNTMVTTRTYQKTFKSILKKCNIPQRNFHALRHTFATRTIELGIDVKSLSEILGHKNAVITLNRYSHSLLEYKMDMMNKLGRLLI